jgi:hypothetical protein
MKKVVCIMFALAISGLSFAKKGGDRRFVASLDNNQAAKARKASGKQSQFTSSRRYSGITHAHGFHLFRRKGGKGGSQASGVGI